MSKQQETFEEHVDRMNEAAQFAATLQGLGVDSRQTKPEDVSIKVIERIDEVIGAGIEEVDNERKIEIRDLLVAQLDKFFVKEAKPEKALSMLDLVTLGLVEDEDIKKFLRIHGVDLENGDDKEYIERVFSEATDFFDNYIVSRNKKLTINSALRKVNSDEKIFNIFKVAAGKGHRQLIPQACALLRIATVIDYIERDPMIALLPTVWEEMERKAQKYISGPVQREAGKVRYLKNDPTLFFSFEKRTKEKTEVVAKLLHKPNNRTEEVLDHIGWRFISDSAVDTLKLIYKIFFDTKTAIFPYGTIRTGKIKNLMLDEAKLLEALSDTSKATDLFNKLSEKFSEEKLIAPPDVKNDENPHSLSGYRAIHIPFDLPITLENGSRAFFPIEIQFFDRKSKTKTENEAPHPAYKGRQQEEVAKRVTNGNLLTTFEQKLKK